MPHSLIVAMSENRVIGRAGRLPWHLSADLRRFQQLTMGHTIVMGRKTFESIGRPLPGRNSIVISRQQDYQPPGVRVAASLDDAERLATGDSQVFFIGGGEVYRQTLARVERIYLTLVHATVPGDTDFPELPPEQWRLAQRTDHAADEKNDFPISFLIYERATSVPDVT
jgi:dihydrofolate reductase